MPQRILAGRASDLGPSSGVGNSANAATSAEGDSEELEADSDAALTAKVDQIVLSRDPEPILRQALHYALHYGVGRTPVETAVAYRTRCVRLGDATLDPLADSGLEQQLATFGVWLGRPGLGFANAVHLERFASPARLALTDDPRQLALGGMGMLTLVASNHQLALALARGQAVLRPPATIQILITGKFGPFVAALDAALELVRQGLAGVVERVEQERNTPVALEFTGPSCRLLSVQERAVLCAAANLVGAAGAVFVSDDRTEGYLRDQRRSKAHRGLAPDAGATSAEVLTLDLSTLDPLVLTPEGNVQRVRELEGLAVGQCIVGGDLASARDLLATALSLKSKRVPGNLDLLLAPPSRQTLEVLAQEGALTDLLSTGVRILEPDAQILRGLLYPATEGASLRAFFALGPPNRNWFTASADTLAASAIAGKLVDPRALKRPARVTLPRAWPTEDTLFVRPAKTDAAAAAPGSNAESSNVRGASPLADTARASGAHRKLQVRVWGDSGHAPSATPDLALVAKEPETFTLAVLSAPLPAGTSAVFARRFSRAAVATLAGDGIAAVELAPAQLARFAVGESCELLLEEPSHAEVPYAEARLTYRGNPEPGRWIGHAQERAWVIAGGP